MNKRRTEQSKSKGTKTTKATPDIFAGVLALIQRFMWPQKKDIHPEWAALRRKKAGDLGLWLVASGPLTTARLIAGKRSSAGGAKTFYGTEGAGQSRRSNGVSGVLVTVASYEHRPAVRVPDGMLPESSELFLQFQYD